MPPSGTVYALTYDAFGASLLVSRGDYKGVVVWLLYYQNCNTAYFDNVQLTQDTFGNTYTYDEEGNLVSTTDLQGKEEYAFRYDGNNQLIKETSLSGGKIFYTYDKSKPQQLENAVAGGVAASFTYDAFGNVTSSTTLGNAMVDGAIYYIRSAYLSQYWNVENGSSAEGTDAILSAYEKTSAFRWKLIRHSDGTVSFSPECAPDLLLSLDGSSPGDLVNIILLPEGDSPYQRFTPSRIYGNIYSFDLVGAGYSLDCNAEDLYIYHTHHNTYQQFALIPVEGNEENPTIPSWATYTENGAYTETVTDSRGNTQSYEYHEDLGLLKSETDAAGTETEYSYNGSNLLSGVSSGSSSVQYAYTSAKELSTVTTPSGTVYALTYDAFGRSETVSVGSTLLSRNTYNRCFLLCGGQHRQTQPFRKKGA